MKRISVLMNFQFLTLSVIILCVFIPIIIYAGTYYNCTDKEGNVTLSDYPKGGQTCKQVQTYEETKSTREENTRREHIKSDNIPSGGKTTNEIELEKVRNKQKNAAEINSHCQNTFRASVVYLVNHPKATFLSFDVLRSSNYTPSINVITTITFIDPLNYRIICTGPTAWSLAKNTAEVIVTSGVMTQIPAVP